MKRVIEWIREHLESGILDRSVPCLSELRRTEWSSEFEELMRNRLVMGALRYQTFEDRVNGRSVQYDYSAAVKRKVELYEETLNLEHLVDAANYLMLEFEFGRDKAHFTPIDDGEHIERLQHADRGRAVP